MLSAILKLTRKYQILTFTLICYLSSSLIYIPVAQAVTLTDNDNGAEEFGAGAHQATQWDAGNSWIELSGASLALPDDGSSTDWFDMTNNELLLHMEEASGNPVDDSTTNATCTATSLTYSATGKLSNAIDFNGSSSYADCGDQAAFSYTEGGGNPDAPFSVCTWMNSDTDQTSMMVSKMTTGAYEWQFGTTTGYEIQFYVYSSVSAYVGGVTSAYNYSPDTWYHVCGTYSGSGTTAGFKIYINGASASLAGGASSYTAMSNTAAPLQVGRQNISGSLAYFNGILDEVAVFSEELSATDVQDIYNAGAGLGGAFTSRIMDAGASTSWSTFTWTPQRPTYKELPNNAATETAYSAGNVDMANNELLFHMNESSGNLTDDSGNGNTGTITGATLGTAGKLNTALSFDGNDYVTTSTLDTMGATTRGTITLWAKWTTADGNERPLVNDDGAGYFTLSLNQGTSTGNKLQFATYESSAANWIQGATTIQAGQWYFVAAVWDDTGTNKIYLNGVEDATGTGHNPQLGTTAIRLAKWGSDYFSGVMDEVAFFSEALTATKVADIYKRRAQQLKFQVRSCNDVACSGESWSDYYSELTDSDLGLPSITLGVADNQYFQYRAKLDTNNASYSPEMKSVSITNAATPTITLTVDNANIAEAAAVATFTATASATSASDMTVNFSFSGTAALTDDYTKSGTSCTITAGNTACTVTATAVQDTLDEASETVIVDISSVTNGTESGTQQQTTTITDDDATPSLSIDDVTVTEGTSATFTATLLAASGQQVTVDYATSDGTATTAGLDYTSASGTFTFAVGEITKTVSVTTNDDALDEAAETYTVTLSNPSSTATISDATGTGTLNDNDATPTLSIADATVAESAGTASFTVTLSAASGQTVTTTYGTGQVDGGATVGVDLNNTSGTLTFVPGDTSETITVTINEDTLDEANETYSIALITPSNATYADDTATGTITDNDATPSLSIDDVTVTEGTSATFTATLSAASGQQVTVNYATSDGTATTAGLDYTSASGTFTFAAGEITKTVSVTTNDDALDEAAETYTVTLSNPSITATISDATGTGTLNDNNAAPTVTLSLADSPLAENAGVATATATLSAVSGQTVTVDLAFSGTATNTTDYTLSASSITINKGATTGTLTVTGVNDLVDEANETVVMDIDSVTNGTESGTQQVSASITDDDTSAVTLTQTDGSTTATEGGPSPDTYTRG